MAAIERIRKHSGLLIAIIGLALLAFVLQDLFQSTGRNRENNIAVIDGERIPYQDFITQKDKDVENMKSRTGKNLTTDENLRQCNATFEQMIKDHIMTKEYEALGMNVSSEELTDQFTGENPHEWVVSSFSNPDGTLNRENLNYYLENLNDFPVEARMQWMDFERAVKADRLETKFENLVKASYFVPAKLAKKYYENKNIKASADIVALRYSNIPDSTVVVTDNENKKYYEENKYRYETDEVRDIEYVIFDIKPSVEDRQDALAFVNGLKEDFATVENVESFVNANSDQRYDSTWMGRKDVPQQIETSIFDAGHEAGFVFGPYENEDAYNLVRIVDMQNRPDSLMASHILISYAGAARTEATMTKEEAEAKADSLLAVLKGSKDADLFAELAGQFSTDPGSKDKGGDLGWFTDGTMVTDFNEFVVNNPVGTIGKVETPFGYHIIKVTDKTAAQPKVRLAVLKHDISYSTKTAQNVFADANRFVTENKTYDQFNAAIEEQGLTKRTMPRMNYSTYQITGVNNPREIVRWAFDEKTKVGDISTVYDLDDMYVVAALTNIVPEGYAPISIVAEQAKYQIMNLKKGEMAVEKMNACGNDINRMVSELGAESTTISDVNIESRVLSNFGVEADIIGTILGMKEGQEVGPVAGNSSAFIIKNVKFTTPEETTDYSDIYREKTSQFNNKVLGGSIYSALRNKAKIEDNRIRYY